MNYIRTGEPLHPVQGYLKVCGGSKMKGTSCQGGVVGYPRGLWIPRPGFESRPWPIPFPSWITAGHAMNGISPALLSSSPSPECPFAFHALWAAISRGPSVSRIAGRTWCNRALLRAFERGNRTSGRRRKLVSSHQAPSPPSRGLPSFRVRNTSG